MTIQIFNTLTRKKEVFEPVQPGKVGIYVCGPTVYAPSHIGHMVGPVIFDTIKRYLAYNGYQVTFVINITDIDDKIINQAAKENCTYADLAKRITADYFENLNKLGVKVDHFPKATEYIPEMQNIIAGLIAKDRAYAAGGDVYFDVTKDEDYGKLSNRKIDELLAGTRKEVSDLKRNAGDFALWKGAKPGEPAWESPWGPGRPGWHIECSAMSMKLLGETFDIHGGGLDLCFPHHEDEIAQSESFTDKLFAKYWMHNGLVQAADATRKVGARADDYASQEEGKISKSKGASAIRELFAKHTPETLRYFLLATHYRSPINFSDARLQEAGANVERIHNLADLFERITGQSFYKLAAPTKREKVAFNPAASPFLTQVDQLRTRFLEFMDDDFNTGGAFGVLSEIVTAINRFAAQNKMEDTSRTLVAGDQKALIEGAKILKEITQVFGVAAQAPAKQVSDDSLTPKLLDILLELRNEARKTKNFKQSDFIRDKLAALGVVIQDGVEGTRWKVGEGAK